MHTRKVAVCKSASSTAEQGKNPEKQYHCVTERAKKIWSQQQNEELVHMSKRDNRHLWKVFKTSKGSACLVALAAQFDASVSLMGFHPAGTPERPAE